MHPSIRVFFLLLLCGTFYRCTSASDEAFSAMETLLGSESLSHADSVAHHFNENTFAYLEEVQALVRADDMHGLEALGKQNDCPITTTIIGKSLQPIVADSTGEAWKTSTVMVLLDLMDFGIYRHSEEFPFRTYEVLEATDEQARVNVTVPTGSGNAKLLSTFRLDKEGDHWKLDYPSTLRFHEAVFRQAVKRRGISVAQFADEYLQSNGSAIEFSYRSSL